MNIVFRSELNKSRATYEGLSSRLTMPLKGTHNWDTVPQQELSQSHALLFCQTLDELSFENLSALLLNLAITSRIVHFIVRSIEFQLNFNTEYYHKIYGIIVLWILSEFSRESCETHPNQQQINLKGKQTSKSCHLFRILDWNSTHFWSSNKFGLKFKWIIISEQSSRVLLLEIWSSFRSIIMLIDLIFWIKYNFNYYYSSLYELNQRLIGSHFVL